MRGKYKSFVEDTIVLFVIAVIIYVCYVFFFASEKEKEIINDTSLIERNIMTHFDSNNESINNEDKVDSEKISEEVAQTQKEKIDSERTSDDLAETQKEEIDSEKTSDDVAQTQKEEINSEKTRDDIAQTQKEEIIQVDDTKNNTGETLIEKKVEAVIKPLNTNKITNLDLLYKNIEENIYSNIERNIDKTSIKSNDFVSIRVTILQDGRYEQLTFTDGNKDNFELIKSSITQVFPVKINDTLKENFPRYFRMKIEIK